MVRIISLIILLFTNQIYAENAILGDNENKIVFNLFNGFKLSFKDSYNEARKFILSGKTYNHLKSLQNV